MSSIYQRAPLKPQIRPGGSGMAAAGGKAAKGGAKGGARQIVNGARVNGTIVDWKGNYAWIQPFYPINHPDAAKKPFIFMSVNDIEQELDEMNPCVSFVAYADGTGLGAQQVRPATSGGCGVYGGRQVQVARASPYGAHPIYGSSGVAAASPYGRAGGKGAGAMAMGARKVVTHEQISGTVSDLLRTQLWEPVQAVAELEESWTPEETLKRVVRYLYKGSMAEDPTKKEWQKAVKDFITKAADGYNRACNEKAWYESLDITPALGAAAWEIAQVCDGYPRPKKADVEAHAADLYHAHIHHAKLDKFMWEVMEVTFGLEEKKQMKLWRAMSSSYWAAFDGARVLKAGGDKAASFLKAWMKDTLNRCWQGFDDPEVLFSEDNIIEFYKGLICGDEGGFSCVPPTFIEEERTIEEFEEVLRAAYQDFQHEWANPPESKAQAKARRKAEQEAAEAAEAA